MKVKETKKAYAKPSAEIVSYVDSLAKADNAQLVELLRSLDVWRFARGDLHSWIPALDRFDAVLEAIVKDYGLEKPQSSPFAPQDKLLVLEVLRVTRMLLENCTSRKLFASYDRCYDILCTNDLDVLQSSIFVIFRPAQQYLSGTPMDSALLMKLRQRLLSLSRGWEKRGSLVKLVTKDEHEGPNEPVSITFYPQSSSSKEASITLDLSTISEDRYVDELADKAASVGMPAEDQFSAFNLLRVMFMRGTAEKQQLLAARLMAMATYACVAREDTLTHSIFLYEPDIIAHVAELLPPTNGVSDDTRAAALVLLDTLGHQKGRLGEMLAAVNVNANYGTLMSLFRSVSKGERSHDVADAMLSLLGWLTSVPSHMNVIVGAGGLHILLDFLDISVRRTNYIPRVCGLIDTITSTVPGSTTFTGMDGVNIIVARIKAELDRLLDLPKQDLVSHDSMLVWATTPLKAVLRTMHRLMQGGGDGLRNLVDGDLPKAVRRIFEDNEKYGPKVYAIATNIMTTFINNEPTSLSILQELKLPQTLYEQLERSIPTSAEMMTSIPNAISAICLNQSGLTYTLEHPGIITNLVATSIEPAAADHASQTTGGALEELARHQPPLREIIQKTAMDQLRVALDEARAFEVPEGQEERYLLERIPQEMPKDPPTNAPLEKVGRVIQFFEGLLRNSTICKQLIKDANIVNLFLSIAEMPCIPIRFGTTDTAHHISHVLRIMSEHDHIVLAEQILKSVEADLDACKPLWESGSHFIWMGLHQGTADAEQVKLFYLLRAAVVRITYLGETLSSLSFSHVRIATSLAKCLRKAPGVLNKFAALHRTAMREHAVLRASEKINEADMVEAETENGKESGAKFLATRIHAVSISFFKSCIRLLYVKRNPDGSHASEAKKLAKILAQISFDYLDVDMIEGKEQAITAFALATCTSLLFDERGYDGHANTTLLFAFMRTPGLDTLASVCEGLINAEQSGSGTSALIVTILSALVSARAIVEGPQAAAVQASLSDDPADQLVRIRSRLYPLIRRIWEADWLINSSQSTIKTAIKAYLSVYEGKSEASASAVDAPAPAAAAAPVPRVRPVADPVMIGQLVDMGFSRAAAELALFRTHNNVAAATELIFSAPHIYAEVPDPDPEPAAPIEAEGEPIPAPAGVEARAESPAEEADNKMETDDSGTDMEAIRQSLAREREQSKADLSSRAMVLLDSDEELVFQLLPAFPTGKDAVGFVQERLNEVVSSSDVLTSGEANDKPNSTLSARLRLALIVFNTYGQDVDIESNQKMHDIVSAIGVSGTETLPKWAASLCLLGEAVLRISSSIPEAKLGDEAKPLSRSEGSGEFAKQMAALARKLIVANTNDQVLAGMRMLVLLSRTDKAILDDVSDILQIFSKSPAHVRKCHPLLALVVRHAFEDSATLAAVMRRELLAWMTPTRNKVSDVNHFVRQLRHVAARDPSLFIDTVESECTLVDPTPSTSVFHIRSKNAEKVAETSDPFKNKPTNEKGVGVLRLLLEQLGTALITARSGAEQSEKEAAVTYANLLVSLITEVLGSYIAAKQAFLQVLRPPSTGPKGISGLLSDFVCGISLRDTTDSTKAFDVTTRMTLSKWGSSMIIALCSDIAPTNDIKDLPEDLISVRKQVLDAIAKAIKESGSIADLDARYGRLYALGELVYRLLVSRVSVAPKQDESGTHIAKTMIEKNFVSIMTAAAGEVDLNYPAVRGVLASILKALEHLSKMSIKWSKSDKGKPAQDDAGSTTESEDSEMDYSDEEEAPDLYRNSALGRLGAGVDEDMDDEEDGDEDEDMFDDDTMDDMDDGSTGSQPLTDEDDDDGEDDMEGTDPEDDWGSDVESLESVEGAEPIFEQEAIIGGEDEGEALEGWDADEDDHESLLSDEEEQLMEEEMYDDEDEMLEDEEGFDDLEMIDGAPANADIWGDGAQDPTMGPWGWDLPSASRQSRMSRLNDDDYMSALYGAPPPRPAAGAIPHPLLSPPSAPVPARRVPPNRSGTNALDSLLRQIQTSGGPEAMAALESINSQHRTGGGEPVRIDLAHDEAGNISLRVGSRTFRIPSPTATASQTDSPADYSPRPTTHRWQEEASIIPGRDNSQRLVMHVINRLMPEAKRLAEEEAAKRAKEAEEEAKKKTEEEKENAEREKANPPATEAQNMLDAAAGVELPPSRATPLPPALTDDVDMEIGAPASNPSGQAVSEQVVENAPEGMAVDEDLAPAVETAEAGPSEPSANIQPEAPSSGSANEQPTEEAGPAESLARTLIQIHGRDVDITDTGIDLDFLQALPDDMRAEVVEQHMREQARHQRPANTAANAPEASSQINAEFLQALPPNIRAEVLMQEAVESARRAQPSAPPAPAAPAVAPRMRLPDMFNLPGLEPGMLAGFDDLLMQGLSQMTGPQATGIARRAMAAGAAQARAAMAADGVPVPAPPTKRPHRESLQLLDRNGIAALVRLLFFPEAFKRGFLFRILVNLCENSTSRADLLNLLISVVQDGSGDLPAVDRSFQQMSLRGLATPKATPKLKAPETPGPIALPIFANLQAEHIPSFIAQRCFEALTYIVSANQSAINFFLTEHEQAIGLRKAPSKKGKGKEKALPQTKFPIVILLGLLDRPVLLKTNAMMESITGLLATITRPLSSLKVDKEKEAAAEEKGEDENMDPPPAPINVEPPTLPAPVPPVTPANTAAASAVPASSAPPDEPGPSATTVPPSTALGAPVIPPNVLRLVVNCMTTGECTSRTFGNSLLLMQNLSYIPDAKDIILQEIRAKCQELGLIIQAELSQLASDLEMDGDASEIRAMSKFSPASSSQAQLLRLLKTIDFLNTHKSTDNDIQKEVLSSDEQKVAEIFASFEFDAMWRHLGQCLGIVEAKDNTEQVAVVLLPLVEALMVVCKYRTQRAARATSEPTPQAETDLFVSFTTAHRKVLNTIVRNNPSLLSGSFSLLVRNPKVLEFDNKRNWFFQKLKRKRDYHSGGSLHLNIRRQYVFEDSFHALQRRTGDEIKYGKLNIKFYNEDGVDAGGVTREWYSVLARQIFDPNFALFEPCAADQQTYQPNKASAVNGEHLAYFKFVGRVIGKSIYDGRLLDAYFSRAFYKQILGRTVDIRDLESIDPEYHKSLQWMLENDITGVIDQEFTIEDEEFGEKKIVELKEGGAKIPVTEENKGEYVRLVVSYRLDNSIKAQIKAFLDGFYDVIPSHLIQIFEPDQLELLISGMTTVDVDELKNATQMSGWKSTDPEISWFWRALRSFSQEERSRFLMFVTSSSRVPLGGFTQLQGASGIQPFQIQKLYSKDGSLPQASTCFNLLLLPKYESYEQLKERLAFAVTETGGFGKA